MILLIDIHIFYNTLWPRYMGKIGSGAHPGKMLPVRIIETNKIDAYFRKGL